MADKQISCQGKEYESSLHAPHLRVFADQFMDHKGISDASRYTAASTNDVATPFTKTGATALNLICDHVLRIQNTSLCFAVYYIYRQFG